jgi:hypothetical protein
MQHKKAAYKQEKPPNVWYNFVDEQNATKQIQRRLFMLYSTTNVYATKRETVTFSKKIVQEKIGLNPSSLLSLFMAF